MNKNMYLITIGDTLYMNQNLHKDKLIAALNNSKVPEEDKKKVQEALERYKQWINDLQHASKLKTNKLDEYIKQLNDYRKFIDIDLIFDSKNDFLYRQKGQLKLDNSVIEEFMQILIQDYFQEEILKQNWVLGSHNTIASISIDLNNKSGIIINTKAQDFAIAKSIKINVSNGLEFKKENCKEILVPIIATECKTNLDKTMFQEANSTSNNLKRIVPAAKYYLICEWLDMKPINTNTTSIDEVLILRKAKRLNSNIRNDFNTYKGRMKNRETYLDYLENNPFKSEMFQRLIEHIEEIIKTESANDTKIFECGYF